MRFEPASVMGSCHASDADTWAPLKLAIALILSDAVVAARLERLLARTEVI